MSPGDLIAWLTAPFEYPFMTRALVAVILTGVVCAVTGTFLVLRGMAFLGDALAHSILPGVAAGYLIAGGIGPHLFWWGLGTAIATSLGIGAISKGGRLKEDTAIGIFFAGMFALGIAMISSIRNYALDLTHILFGNVLGVSAYDVWLMAGFSAGILLVIGLLFKEFVIISFDATLAATLRLPARGLHYLLLVVLAVTIMVALQTVGIALLLALLVTPAATGYLLCRRVTAMMKVAIANAVVSGVAGLYLSFYLNIATGPAIVLVSTGLFLIAYVLGPRRVSGWRGMSPRE